MKKSTVTRFFSALSSGASRITIGTCLALGTSGLAHATIQEISIEAQGMNSALLELAEETQSQIIFSPDLVKGIETNAINGNMTISDAVSKMLEGTSLGFEKVSGTTFVIKQSGSNRAGFSQATNTQTPTAASKASTVDTSNQNNSDKEDEGQDANFQGSNIQIVNGDDERELDNIIVTGSRLKGVSGSSPVVTLDQEDFQRRGLSSVEDIVRFLPQNYSTITGGATFDRSGVPGFEGASTINLRGLGEGTTLVLINGKRIPASPTGEGTFTDISTIPLSAIERVEVLTDGASAIYGSDAIGGVLNIILRSDYRGSSTRARYESSNSGGDRLQLDQTLGASWDSGNLTATLTYQKDDAVDAGKAGVSLTGDFSAQGGRVFRTPSGQPGVIILGGAPFLGQAPGQSLFAVLPEGNGTNISIDDLQFVSFLDGIMQTGTFNLLPSSVPGINNQLTPEQTIFGGSVTLDQELTDKLDFNVSAILSVRDSEVRQDTQQIAGLVTPTQAFNTFGVPLRVGYFLTSEIASGALAAPIRTNKTTRFSINPSLTYDFGYNDWQGEFSISYGSDENEAALLNAITPRFGGTNAALDEALSSSDPNVALNVFGDGSVQRGNLNDLTFTDDSGSRSSEQIVYGLNFSGKLTDLPAGAMQLAVGAEHRTDSLDFGNFEQGDLFVSDEVESENIAAFAELSVPIFGSQNAKPFFQELTLIGALRYDEYKFDGPFEGPDLPSSERTFDSFTARLGASWRPVEDLKLRTSWGQSFQAPTLPSLFEPRTVLPSAFIEDEFAPGGFAFVFAPATIGGNPDLLPQDGETLTLGFDFTPSTVEGLNISATWSKIDFENIVAGTQRALGGSEGVVEAGQVIPGLVERDAAGNITSINFSQINLSSRTSETLDLSARYEIDTSSYGTFTPGLLATHTISLESLVAEAPGIETVEEAGTDNGPPDWSVAAFLDWNKDNWSANATLRHTDGFTITDPLALIPDVDGYTTVDFQLGYNWEEKGLKFIGGVQNAFDKDFPFADTPFGVASERVDFRRRVFFLEVTKEFDF